jgi:mRNA interferase MazF
MKVKTSITLSEDLLEAIDQQSDQFKNRSDFIEAAVRAFIAQMLRDEQNARDLAIINQYADRLNQEAADVLGYQVLSWRNELRSFTHRPETRKHRVFVVVSRQVLIESRFSTIVCAPIYSTHDGLSTQVLVGVAEGLKHDSSIHCDELVSLPKAALTQYVGALSSAQLAALNQALRVALDLAE